MLDIQIHYFQRIFKSFNNTLVSMIKDQIKKMLEQEEQVKHFR